MSLAEDNGEMGVGWGWGGRMWLSSITELVPLRRSCYQQPVSVQQHSVQQAAHRY